MVEGVEQFTRHFESFPGSFVVIGGTACAAVLEDAGLPFRTTKDIDIVLIAEALDESFMKAFWVFIEEGQYMIRESAGSKRLLYRFEKPQKQGFPPCLELFSRIPIEDNQSYGHRMQIKVSGTPLYLSAILMDDDYYHFVVEGIQRIDGIPFADVIHLIPLKAKAWLDMNTRRASGEAVDSRDVEKHRRDILRLFTVIDPGTQVKLSEKIRADIATFLFEGFKDWEPNMKSLGLGNIGLLEVVQGLRDLYLNDNTNS